MFSPVCAPLCAALLSRAINEQCTHGRWHVCCGLHKRRVELRPGDLVEVQDPKKLAMAATYTCAGLTAFS